MKEKRTLGLWGAMLLLIATLFTPQMAWADETPQGFTVGDSIVTAAANRSLLGSVTLGTAPTFAEGGDNHAVFTAVPSDACTFVRWIAPDGETITETSPVLYDHDITMAGRYLAVFKINLTQTNYYHVKRPKGSGTKEDPYLIACDSNLYYLVEDAYLRDRYFKQTADIVLAQQQFPGIGDLSFPFQSHYDGDGHTIYIQGRIGCVAHRYWGGVFGCIRNATIENLNVYSTKSSDYLDFKSFYDGYYQDRTDEAVGTVIGRATGSSKILNVTSNVRLEIAEAAGSYQNSRYTSHIGGIVGWIEDDTEVHGCTYYGLLNARDSHDGIGGIVGYSVGDSNCKITHCMFNGQIDCSSTDKDHTYIGGILGYVNDEKGASFEGVYNCYVDGIIIPDGSDGFNKVAAIIGCPRGDNFPLNKIVDNYYAADVSVRAIGNSKDDNKGFDASRNKSITLYVSADANGSTTREYVWPHYDAATPANSTDTKLQVTPVGKDHQHFDYWTGASSSTKTDASGSITSYDRSDPKILSLTSNVDLSAHFTIDRHNITYRTHDETRGLVGVAPGSVSVGPMAYPYGSTVSMVARRNRGYWFAFWADESGNIYRNGDDGCTTDSDGHNTLTITVSEDKTFTAYFAADAYSTWNGVLVATAQWLTGDITLSDDVIGIASFAFNNNTHIKSVTIPASVTFIQDMAFAGCTKLSTVTFAEGSKCQTLGDNLFYGSGRTQQVNLTSVPTVGNNPGVSYDIALNDNSAVGDGAVNYLTSTVHQPTYTRTQSNVWGTLVVPFDIEGGEDYDLYDLSSYNSQTAALTLTKVSGTVAAGTPVLVRMSEAARDSQTGKYALSLTAVGCDVSTVLGEGSHVGDLTLTGTYTKADLSGGYIINNNTFWSVTDIKADDSRWSAATAAADRHVYCAPFHAYIAASGSGNAPARITIGTDGETTGIEAVEALTTGEAEYYDLNGRRIDDLQQGVNIVKRGNRTFKVIIK